MGLSQAGSILASNAFGRRDRTAISLIGRSTIYMALIYGACCAIGIIIFKNELPLLFNDNASVVSMASYLLIFAAVFQISDSTQATSAGLLRGIKDVKIPTVFIAVAYWIIGIPAGFLLAFYFKMGAAGIWTGFIVGLSFSALFLSLRFKRMGVDGRFYSK
jgi:MATE family multidrug resistance protein